MNENSKSCATGSLVIGFAVAMILAAVFFSASAPASEALPAVIL